MTFTIRVRGASSQHITQEFQCETHGRFTATTPRDVDGIPCLTCGDLSPWCISAPFGSVNGVSVVRGGVAEAPSPMYLDTKMLGEGATQAEWRAHRDKIYAERHHAEKREVLG